VAQRSWRVSAFVEGAIGERVYALATERGCSITGILEEALREYLAARPVGTSLPLAARLPRPPGRPSTLVEKAAKAREARMRKRTGRPLKSRTPAVNPS
jgi:hypothetical protein